jgi:hypothetical protein
MARRVLLPLAQGGRCSMLTLLLAGAVAVLLFLCMASSLNSFSGKRLL